MSSAERRSVRAGSAAPRGSIVGEAPELVAATTLARRVAPMDIPVLIVGETGTGKELLANFIHGHSERAGPLVDVDCGAIPSDLMEALLFGHARGAFTGAIRQAKGLLVAADGGTLLLDEMANLPLAGQAKLLRVLESGRVRQVGGSDSRQVDFRIVATAQGALGGSVRSGGFRQDLFQRVAGVVIELPSLAARNSDIPLLADHFAALRKLQLTEDGKDFLREQAWPGNVRQLKWTITRSGLFAQGDGSVDRAALERALETGPGLVLRRAGDHTNGHGTSHTLAALCRRHAGDVDRIAEDLGIGRSTLYRRVKRAGIDLGRFRSKPRAG